LYETCEHNADFLIVKEGDTCSFHWDFKELNEVITTSFLILSILSFVFITTSDGVQSELLKASLNYS
jgi:hypothetical protein